MAFSEPLYLPIEKEEVAASSVPSDSTLQCLVCDRTYEETPMFLKHLLEEHNIVIEDVNTIANLAAYCK